MSLTNPKVVMFFMAFFPLFLREGSTPGTLVAMMLHVTLIAFAYQAGLVLVGNAAARRLARWPQAGRLATRLAGIALIGFGARLALDTGERRGERTRAEPRRPGHRTRAAPSALDLPQYAGARRR